MCIKSLSYYFTDCYINKSERCGSRCEMSSYHASIKDIYIRNEGWMHKNMIPMIDTLQSKAS